MIVPVPEFGFTRLKIWDFIALFALTALPTDVSDWVPRRVWNVTLEIVVLPSLTDMPTRRIRFMPLPTVWFHVRLDCAPEVTPAPEAS